MEVIWGTWSGVTWCGVVWCGGLCFVMVWGGMTWCDAPTVWHSYLRGLPCCVVSCVVRSGHEARRQLTAHHTPHQLSLHTCGLSSQRPNCPTNPCVTCAGIAWRGEPAQLTSYEKASAFFIFLNMLLAAAATVFGKPLVNLLLLLLLLSLSLHGRLDRGQPIGSHMQLMGCVPHH